MRSEVAFDREFKKSHSVSYGAGRISLYAVKGPKSLVPTKKGRKDKGEKKLLALVPSVGHERAPSRRAYSFYNEEIRTGGHEMERLESRLLSLNSRG